MIGGFSGRGVSDEGEVRGGTSSQEPIGSGQRELIITNGFDP
jgi:hypothetical protein